MSPFAMTSFVRFSLTLALLATVGQEEDAPPPIDVVPEWVELQAEVARVPFTLDGGRPVPVVEAMVNGQGPFRFFYDTGASTCVLDSGFVEELGIEIVGTTQLGDHTDTARIAADRVEMEWLELEGILFEGVPAVAFDRSGIRANGIRGVLGLPLFEKHLLTVNYKQARLEVSGKKLPKEGAGIVPFKGDLLPEIPILVGGKEIACHIDSGSPSGLMLPTDFALSLPHKAEPKMIGTARTVNSVLEMWSVQLDGAFVIAGNEFVDPVIGYNEKLPNALVGYEVLKDLELSIDQRSRLVRLVPASEVDEASR